MSRSQENGERMKVTAKKKAMQRHQKAIMGISSSLTRDREAIEVGGRCSANPSRREVKFDAVTGGTRAREAEKKTQPSASHDRRGRFKNRRRVRAKQSKIKPLAR